MLCFSCSSKELIALANPLSSQTAYLLPSHLPALLTTTAEAKHVLPPRIFEIGHLFSKKTKEREVLSILITKKIDPEILIAEIKGVLNHLLKVTFPGNFVTFASKQNSDSFHIMCNFLSNRPR